MPGNGGRVYLFPVAEPGIFLAAEAALSSADRCHSLRSLVPLQAALPSLPIPNTEVKLMYADKPHGRLPGKIGNANTKGSYESRRLFFFIA